MQTAQRPYVEKVYTFSALSASTDQTAFKLPKLNEYNFYLDISTLTSSDSTGVADISLQVTPDGGTTWFVAARFAAATAAGKQRLRFRPIMCAADVAGVDAIGTTGGVLAQNCPIPFTPATAGADTANVRFSYTKTGTLTVLTGSIWLIGNAPQLEY